MIKKINFDEVLKEHLKILKSLQYDSGLFAASSKKVSTGYDKSWLRDNFYECLAFQVLGDEETVSTTYSALIKIFLKHESKIDSAIHQKPMFRHEYIHARFHPETFDEFWEEWGNKQNDAVGAILFGIGNIESKFPGSILKTENELRIVNKLILYLDSIQYWHDFDSGMWEEDEEIHASSVGACVAGLKSIKKVKGVEIPNKLIEKGIDVLNKLLPRESKKKYVDLALLSLIYPYNVVNKEQKKVILENVKYLLLRERGVIRYKNDYYYNKNEDKYSEEAEWTFGLAWLAIIYENDDRKREAKELLTKLTSLSTSKGLPELYFSNSMKYNENTPLGWAESLFIIALNNLHKKHKPKLKNKLLTKYFT